jgi:glycosyltransferase involved in cell wall biosynthesis
MAIKISIVIPTFNRAALLQKCLDILIIQVFPKTDFEIIVVSDGPDKETARVVAKSRLACNDLPAIRYDHLPFKKGPAAARNRGWQHARGKLIAFTDDDCIPNIYWLKAIWDSYHEQDEVAFTGKIIVPRPLRPTDYQRNVANLETAEFVTANCFCTRHALEKVNGFDERFSIAWREDSDLEFNLLAHQIPVEYIEKACIIHPVRPSGWGVSLKEQRKSMYNALLYKKHPRLYRAKIQRRPPWRYYATVVSFLVFIASLLLMRYPVLATLALLSWAILSGWFILKRLSGNSHAGNHILEMIITSLCIPFLSVFWRLFGSVKFKIFFL